MWPALLALILFVLAAGGMALVASRIFGPVSWRLVLLLVAAVAVYLLAVPATKSGPSLSVARGQILSGQVPLWNGEPLLANPRLALAHPFTLLACLAEAPQLAVALRLFTALLFAFVLFRAWDVGTASALLGAFAYAFCTTQIVAPDGALTIAMLPMALAAAQEHVRATRPRTLAMLTVALALVILGADASTAVRVWIVVIAFVFFLSQRLSVYLTTVIAMLFAAGLTAFFWMPLRDISAHIRTGASSWDWSQLLALLAPNVLGTTGPGYAGIITLVLAVVGLLRSERREKWFFLAITLLGFWQMTLCALAALGVCVLARNAVSPRILRVTVACIAFAVLTIWFARAEYVLPSFAWTQALIAFIPLALFALLAGEWRILPGFLAVVLTFGELTLVAQQAKPEVTHFDNVRFARIRNEVPDVLVRFLKTPPVFTVSHYRVQPEIGDVIPRLKPIADLGTEGIVHDVPPSIAADAPQLLHVRLSAPRLVRIREQTARELRIDAAAASGWSLLLTHEVDWPGWRGYWNGSRLPVVTVDGAFSGAFIPPEKGTLVLRYWPAAFIDGVRVSVCTLLVFVIALTFGRVRSVLADRPL